MRVFAVGDEVGWRRGYRPLRPDFDGFSNGRYELNGEYPFVRIEAQAQAFFGFPFAFFRDAYRNDLGNWARLIYQLLSQAFLCVSGRRISPFEFEDDGHPASLPDDDIRPLRRALDDPLSLAAGVPFRLGRI